MTTSVIASIDLSLAVVVLGAITGTMYGASAVGLVVVYRSSRVINFAHGQIGTVAATFLALAVVTWQLPYWLALVLALSLGALVGAASEALVARRLESAPLAISVIATLGLSQLLFLVASIISSGASSGEGFPEPPGLPEFSIGALLVTPAYTGMLILTPLAVGALALFLRRGRLGIAMRAAAANGDAAKMAGIKSERMNGLAWAIAGGLSALTAILVLPTRGFTSADFLGPGLLLRALACAVIGRMTSLPSTLAAGLALGVLEAVLLDNHPRGGLVEMALFLVVAGALLAQRARRGRAERSGTWSTVVAWDPIPDAFRHVFLIRNLGRVIAGAGLVAVALVVATASNATASSLTAIAALTLVGLSVGVLTGLSGQLSLGQFAIAGVGATACLQITTDGGNFLVGLVAAGLAAAVASLVLGIPALRIQGLMLAVTTMGFALAAEAWLFGQSWALGGSGSAPRPPSSSGSGSTPVAATSSSRWP